MKVSKSIRLVLAVGTVLFGIQATSVAAAGEQTDAFCSVINKLNGAPDGSQFKDNVAAVSLSLASLNGVLSSFFVLDTLRFALHGKIDRATLAGQTIKPWSVFCSAVGTFLKSFIPFSTNLAKLLGLPDDKMKGGVLKAADLAKYSKWELFLKRFVQSGATTLVSSMKMNPGVGKTYKAGLVFRFFNVWSYVYRASQTLMALIETFRLSALSVCDRVVVLAPICKRSNRSCSLQGDPQRLQSQAASWWRSLRRDPSAANACAMTDTQKADRLEELYTSNKDTLGKMATGAGKVGDFMRKWASPLKALASVFKPLEKPLNDALKVFKVMDKAMAPVDAFAGAITSLLNKKLCFMPGKCFKLNDLPNLVQKYAKKLTKPLLKKANKLFDKLVKKVLKALPSIPGIDAMTSMIDQLGDLAGKVGTLTDELMGALSVPFLDHVEDLKSLDSDLAAIK